jgi:hypothetical protein
MRRPRLLSYFRGAEALPDGSILLTFSSPDQREFPPVYLRYLPQRDAWSETIEVEINNLRAAHGPLRKLDGRRVMQWTEGKWAPMREIPALDYNQPIYQTTKFLYTETPLGLYRVAWKALQAAPW